MKKFVMNRDRIFSIGIFIFAVLMAWQTSQLKAAYTNIDGSDPGSKLFPYAISIMLMICAVGKFITCNKPDKEKFVGGKKGYLRIFLVLLVLALYAAFLKTIGFLICSFVSGAVLLVIMKEDRKMHWFSPIVFSLILTAILYVLFHVILKVNLPKGILKGIL